MVHLKSCHKVFLILAVVMSAAPAGAQEYVFENGVSFKEAMAMARTKVRDDLGAERRDIYKKYHSEKEKAMEAYYDRVRGLALADTKYFKSENRKELDFLKSQRDAALAEAARRAKVELAFRESELRRTFGISDKDITANGE